MLNKVDFLNKDAVTLYSLNSALAPLHVFDPTVTERVDIGRMRSQQHGTNATQKLRSGLEIHCEGDLYSPDDTSSGYWAQRDLMLLALFGSPAVAPDLTDMKAGTLIINRDGDAEDLHLVCEITLFSAPLAALSPTRTPYAVTFFGWNPWMIGAVSGDRYYIV